LFQKADAENVLEMSTPKRILGVRLYDLASEADNAQGLIERTRGAGAAYG